MIPALVLTAGLATRLRPLSSVRAKAALPVGGIPLAGRILRQLATGGVTDAVLNLHHLPDSLTSRIGDGSDIGIRVRYSWESPVALGSAGGPRQALSLMGASTFLVVNGDTLTDLDIGALVAAHRRSGALVTIAVIPNSKPEHYSGLAADAEGRFVGVVARGSSTPSFHVIGTQVVEARAFADLDLNVPVESIGALYPALIRTQPDAVRVYPCTSSFLDIGTPEDYVETCRTLASSDAMFIERGARVHVDASAQVRNAIVWDDVEIGARARLNGTVVTDGVRVPAESEWDRVILRRVDGGPGPNERQIGQLIVTPLGRA